MSMNSLPHGPATAQALIDMGYSVTPLRAGTKRPILDDWNTRITSHADFQQSNSIGIVCGQQPDGTYLIPLDFDDKPDQGIIAEENFDALMARVLDTDILDKIFITRSTSGAGYHVWLKLPFNFPKGTIRNAAGKRIGDLMGQGGQIVMQPRRHWVFGGPDQVKTLTPDEVSFVLELIHYQAPVERGESTLDWDAVAAWLQRIDTLLINGMPSRFRPTCQGAHYLKNAIPARRTSEIRYALIEELVRCDYDDNQVAALALHLADFGVTERKGRDWLEKDVERIIAKVRASGPRTRRKAAQRDMGIEAVEEKVNKHEAPYLFWLSNHQDGGKVVMSRPQRARSYGVGVRTLDRIEADLIAKGKIVRGLSANRQIAWVETAATPTPQGTATSDDTQVDLDPTAVLPGGVWGGGSTEELAVPETPLLAHVVEDAIEALGESRVRKHRADIILGLVRAYIPDADPEHVAWLAKHAIDWRRQRRADDALREKLAVLSDLQLKSKQRGLERKAADCHEQGRPRQSWIFGRLAWFCQKELDKPERQAKTARLQAIQHVIGGDE